MITIPVSPGDFTGSSADVNLRLRRDSGTFRMTRSNFDVRLALRISSEPLPDSPHPFMSLCQEASKTAVMLRASLQNCCMLRTAASR